MFAIRGPCLATHRKRAECSPPEERRAVSIVRYASLRLLRPHANPEQVNFLRERRWISKYPVVVGFRIQLPVSQAPAFRLLH